METRREFLQKAALLSGASAVWGTFPDSILQALAIDPEEGSTFLDAEHIVVLMQENRSFDHTYGSLQGVRGYNDPRAHIQPNGNPVWLQTNSKGETYAPFRLDIKGTRATWMGSLPHSWTNQVDARNNGRYDKWLHAKPSGNSEYARMPLTLGFYNREDIPFYYAFADAFTVCDHNFCSSLTGTTPNRLFLWTGTVRPTKDGTSFACVRNEEVDYGREASWTTFPERLEDAGISWKIYQNEISLDSGFQGEQDPGYRTLPTTRWSGLPSTTFDFRPLTRPILTAWLSHCQRKLKPYKKRSLAVPKAARKIREPRNLWPKNRSSSKK